MSGGIRGPRPVFFVCVGIDLEKVEPVSRSIQSTSQVEAASLFLEMTKLKAKNIHGPFRQKRAQVMGNTYTMRFDSGGYKAIYDNCDVTAFNLKEPENHAYLIFNRRLDGGKTPLPKGTIIVPISDLRLNNE